MSQRAEFDFEQLSAGTKQAYHLLVTVEEQSHLVDMVTIRPPATSSTGIANLSGLFAAGNCLMP